MNTSPPNNVDTSVSKRICDDCVGEDYLKGLIRSQGGDGTCSYCEEESKIFTIEQLADVIETAFHEHYERTPTDPEGFEALMHYDRDPENNYIWHRRGEEVLEAIASAAEIHQAVAKDVLDVLQDRHCDHEAAKMGDETEFDTSASYARKDPGCHEFTTRWFEFENGLKTEARFFSRSAQAALDEIFAGVADLKTDQGHPIVTTIGPASEVKSLYRARVFAAEDEKLTEALKCPWIHLGPPPMLAASAGRMNARGISVFYGCLESTAALAEVRPPVGSQVAIAKFIVLRPLRILDVEALKSVATSGSIFDRKHIRELQRARFLEILSALMSRPVMPNEEAFEYLTTQAVADYLASEVRLDGIIFPSVQVGHAASNVVLFHHASRVEGIVVGKGTEFSVYLEQQDSDGVSPDYSVWEQVPDMAESAAPSASDPLDLMARPIYDPPSDHRQPSLRIDLDSIEIHHIQAVRFNAKAYPVSRHRSTKSATSGKEF